MGLTTTPDIDLSIAVMYITAISPLNIETKETNGDTDIANGK
jgi:hypothetical protein